MAHGLIAKGPVNSPKWVFFLRIAIILFSILVLAMAAWSIHLHNNPPRLSISSLSGWNTDTTGLIKRQSWGGLTMQYYTAAPALMIFAVIFCLLTHITVYVFEKYKPQLFFRIGVLIAYSLVAIFMLSGWAYLASIAAIYGPAAEDIRKATNNKGSENNYTVQLAASCAAGAALGAVLWVLIIINTVMFILGCLRTQGEAMTSGATELHQVPKAEASVHVAPAGGPAPVYYQTSGTPAPPAASPYATPPPQQVYQQPQPGYPQQQYQQQQQQPGYVVPQQQA